MDPGVPPNAHAERVFSQDALLAPINDAADAVVDHAIANLADWREVERRAALHGMLEVLTRLGEAGRKQEDATRYDAGEVIYAIFQALITHADPQQPAHREYLRAFLAPYFHRVDAMHSDPLPPARHHRFLDYVLEHLSNKSERHAPFRRHYHHLSPDGSAERRTSSFRAIIETFHDRTGALTYELESAFITLYLGAFDVDLKNSDLAAILVLQEQLNKNRYADALKQSRDALNTTLKYLQQTNAHIRAIKRSFFSIKSEALVEDLNSITAHLNEQSERANAITSMLHERIAHIPRNETGDALTKTLKEILKNIDAAGEARLALMQLVSEVHEVFTETADQLQFRREQLDDPPCIATETLPAALELPASAFLDFLDAASDTLQGTHVPDVPNLAEDITYMLAPPRERVTDTTVLLDQPSASDVDVQAVGLSAESRLKITTFMYTIELPTNLELVLKRAHREGFSDIELEHLARAVMSTFVQPVDRHALPFNTHTRGDAFALRHVLFPQAGIALEPRDDCEED